MRLMTTYTDEEIERITAQHKLEKAFLEAKANQKKNPEAYRKAKQELHDHRVAVRTAREQEEPGEGVARPTTAKATGRVKGND
jgi:hypothetical protein